MAAFELGQRYPLAWLHKEHEGHWIVDGFIKSLSPSEAILFLVQSLEGTFGYTFLSSQVCLVGFRLAKRESETGDIYQNLHSITKLWVMLVENAEVVPLRVVQRPISFHFDPYGQSSLSVPMNPPLADDEWKRLRIKYTSLVVINSTEEFRIASERDVEELCQHLMTLPSFLLHAYRFEGARLDVTTDKYGSSVFLLDVDRGVKLISLGDSCLDTESVVRKIDAMPDLESETERRHLIPLERALGILRSFLNKGEPIDMVPWPVDE